MTEIAYLDRPQERTPQQAYLDLLNSEPSKRTMEQALRVLAEMAPQGKPLWRLTWDEVLTLRQRVAERYATPSSRNKMLAGFRGTLKMAWALGHLDQATYAKLASVPGFTGTRVPAGRMLTSDELDRMAAAVVGEGWLARRDAAMLVTLRCGLRREEVCWLDHPHSLEGGTLRVVGKRDKERLVPLPPWGVEPMRRWLAARGPHVGPLFCSGPPRWERLSGQTVTDRMRRWAQRAGLTEHASPHDFRRTLASELLDVTDPHTAQEVLGHARLATTMRYDRRPEARKAEAMAKLHCGGKAPGCPSGEREGSGGGPDPHDGPASLL